MISEETSKFVAAEVTRRNTQTSSIYEPAACSPAFRLPSASRQAKACTTNTRRLNVPNATRTRALLAANEALLPFSLSPSEGERAGVRGLTLRSDPA